MCTIIAIHPKTALLKSHYFILFCFILLQLCGPLYCYTVITKICGGMSATIYSTPCGWVCIALTDMGKVHWENFIKLRLLKLCQLQLQLQLQLELLQKKFDYKLHTRSSADADKPARRIQCSVTVTKHSTIPYVRYSFLLCNSNFVFNRRRLSDIWLQKCHDLENRVRGPSRSLEISPFDRAHTTSYWRYI